MQYNEVVLIDFNSKKRRSDVSGIVSLSHSITLMTEIISETSKIYSKSAYLRVRDPSPLEKDVKTQNTSQSGQKNTSP